MYINDHQPSKYKIQLHQKHTKKPKTKRQKILTKTFYKYNKG